METLVLNLMAYRHFKLFHASLDVIDATPEVDLKKEVAGYKSALDLTLKVKTNDDSIELSVPLGVIG